MFETNPSIGLAAEEKGLELQKLAQLRRSFEALLRSHRSMVLLGRDTDVEELAEEHGFELSEFCMFRVASRGITASLLCVPNKIWYCPKTMARLHEVKEAAAILGHTVLLLPETFVTERLHGAGKPSANALPCGVSYNDRLIILQHLIQKGHCNLSELAGLLHHPNPVDAVLQLAVAGILDVDLDSPIRPASRVQFQEWH
jgi:hypothetical protein